MGCEYIYTDSAGNPSAIYYRALKEFGPERAEEIYIRHMMGIIDTRLSKPIFTKLEDTQGKLESTETEGEFAKSVYTEKSTGDIIDRMTGFIKSVTVIPSDQQNAALAGFFGTAHTPKDPLEEAKIAQARNLIAMTLAPEKQLTKDMKDREVDALIAEEAKNGRDLLEAAKTDITALWKAKEEYGTLSHAILSNVLIKYQEVYDAQPENPDGTKPHLTETALWQIITDVKDDMGHDQDNVRVAHLLNNVLKEIDKASKKYNGGKPLRIKSEQQIFSKKLKIPNSSGKGIGGTVDITLTNDDNSMHLTMDFKTKADAKVQDFNKSTGAKIGGPFNVDDSPENRARAQQLGYAAIYKEEYGMHIQATANVIVPLFFFQETAMGEAKTVKLSDIGSYKWKGYLTGEVPPVKFQDVGNDIEPVLVYFKENDAKTYYSDAREVGIAGITERWSGTNADGQPNATYLKQHKEPYIKKKMREIRTNKEGKRIARVFNRNVDVTNKSDDEIRQMLSIRYDEEQKVQGTIARDVIEFFTHPERKVPQAIIDRRHSISKLLQGFSPDTHTMELAQNDPELAGIGPDVIIVRHNQTGAISLLSTIVAENSVVKHEITDGSKDARSSLLGKYIPDKLIASGRLEESLMSEPKVHDYISMKLGLAAMILNQRNKGKFSIDKMRVATVSMGDRYSVTSTNLEHELSKINQFALVAGDDFPDEYKPMLADISTYVYAMPAGKSLEGLIRQMRDNTDPMHSGYRSDLKDEIVQLYDRWNIGDLVGYELKTKLGKYQESIANRLKTTKTDEEVLRDPRYVIVSTALLELQRFDNDLQQMGALASERISAQWSKSAITSGDKILMKTNTLYVEASSRIRKDMDKFSKEHNKVLKALMKDSGIADIVNSDLAFKKLYKVSDDPEDRMRLLNDTDSEWGSLSQAQKDYINFFNDNIVAALERVAPDRNKQDIRDGVFWNRGNVPVIERAPELISAKTLTSWQALREAAVANFKTLGKTETGVSTILLYDLKTKFDAQATDSAVGNSEHRRRALGILDLNAPQPPVNMETNLAHILNLATLEASQKDNFKILLQTVTAQMSLLAGEGERARMTEDMLKNYREMVIMSRYPKPVSSMENVSTALDAANRASSTMTFAWSLAQGFTEFGTATVQTTATFLSNAMQNAIADYIFKDPNKRGRFGAKELTWASQVWFNKYNEKFDQMLRDGAIIQYDPNDEKTEEFKALDKQRTFRSKAGFWLNRLSFNSALAQVFLAQMKYLGITEAYVYKDDAWVYDETLDPRFFVYDPARGLGTNPPSTPEEKEKFSKWKAVRKQLDLEGALDPDTKRMLQPMTAAERSEIKNYGTRIYGSFNSDAKLDGEKAAFGRAAFRYKKWFPQKVANYWTPTIRDAELYGHWKYTIDPQTGEDVTVWVGDDFQGILQTMAHMTKELIRTRNLAFMGELNQYQRENISKLIADLCMALLMFLFVLPFLLDEEVEVDAVSGEDIKVKGDFGKSQLGKSMHRSASNALADLFLVSSLQSMGTSVLPGIDTAISATGSFMKILASAVSGGEKLQDQSINFARSWGAGKSAIMAFESITGEPIQ